MAFSQCADCRDKFGAGAEKHGKPGFSIPSLEPEPNIWIHHLTQAARTGDVVLFSSRHATSNLTKFFTNSSWDHVGVVVKPTPRRAYLVEWGGGLFATELVERLSEYDLYDAREITWRHLKVASPRSPFARHLGFHVCRPRSYTHARPSSFLCARS